MKSFYFCVSFLILIDKFTEHLEVIVDLLILNIYILTVTNLVMILLILNDFNLLKLNHVPIKELDRNIMIHKEGTGNDVGGEGLFVDLNELYTENLMIMTSE